MKKRYMSVSVVTRRKWLLNAQTILVGAIFSSSLLRADSQVTVNADSSSNTLVVYFTRSGNTRVIGNQLHRDLPADLFEIEPATPYPADYLANVEEARREKESGTLRAIKTRVANWSQYERIFLGFPIWGGSPPAVIRTFLSEHDTNGKEIIPFITHGKYGVGNSQSVIRSYAPKAYIQDGFSRECDQERDTMVAVDSWISKLK